MGIGLDLGVLGMVRGAHSHQATSTAPVRAGGHTRLRVVDQPVDRPVCPADAVDGEPIFIHREVLLFQFSVVLWYCFQFDLQESEKILQDF